MQPNKRPLNFFMLAMINVAAICNIANLSISAKYGFTAIFYLIIACLLFFIPVSLVSAELATGWPQKGGVYIWVRTALGERFGFLAIWLQWIENIFWYPTVLSFAASAFAYIINPELASNKFYIMGAILVVFWIATIINLFGMEISGWISTLCAIFGIVLPGLLIISLGLAWILTGNPSQITFSLKAFLPDITSINQLSLIVGVLLSLGGMEMSAVHAAEVKNPKRNYPISILISAIIIIGIISLGALSIGVVIPADNISLPSGSVEALSDLMKRFGFGNAIPVVATFMTIGALGMISTWTIGPVKGVYVTKDHGELPPFLQKSNKKDVPVALLLIQAIIVSFLSLFFIFMPNVSSSYWMLFCLTAQFYLIMYILMFISAIVLRYKKADVERHFKIPFGNIGMWVISSLGIIGAIFAIIIGFFPPFHLDNIKTIFFEMFLIGGIVLFSAIPFIINYYKDPKWLKYAIKAKSLLKKDIKR